MALSQLLYVSGVKWQQLPEKRPNEAGSAASLRIICARCLATVNREKQEVGAKQKFVVVLALLDEEAITVLSKEWKAQTNSRFVEKHYHFYSEFWDALEMRIYMEFLIGLHRLTDGIRCTLSPFRSKFGCVLRFKYMYLRI